MTERNPHKIEQADIVVPKLSQGETAVIFQRHGKYNRDRGDQDAGSLFTDDAERIKSADEQWFHDVLAEGAQDTYVLFVSSDTQYAGKGHRSLETGQLAQDAAVHVMKERGIDANEHILNLKADFSVAYSQDTGQSIRPMSGIREPDIFNPADKSYLVFLQQKYGYADEEAKTGLTPAGWAAHEMDVEKVERLKTGAEGQQDLIDRTKKSLYILERYARVWHANNPGKKLVIWATSHYDTVNPLVKEIDGQLKNDDGTFADTYQPVDYGGGIVLKFSASIEGARIQTRVHHGVRIGLGNVATRQSVTRLGLPKY